MVAKMLVCFQNPLIGILNTPYMCTTDICVAKYLTPTVIREKKNLPKKMRIFGKGELLFSSGKTSEKKRLSFIYLDPLLDTKWGEGGGGDHVSNVFRPFLPKFWVYF